MLIALYLPIFSLADTIRRLIDMATERVRISGSGGQEAEQARALAARYRCEFVDLREAHIDHDLFRSIPVDLMFRYNFVPLHAQNGTLEIALADPRNLNLIDELSLLLNKKLRVKVATLSQIADLLKKTEQSQRVLEEVTEGFTLDVVGDEENARTRRSPSTSSTAADSDIAPVIKLVDTTIFNALERRASDIHIEIARPGSRHQVPHRRRAALRHAAHRQGLAFDDHFAHQGHERARYRRAPRPAGRPFPRALQEPPDRFPRLHHADDSRRRRRAPRARQGVDEREVRQALARRGRASPMRTWSSSARYIKEPYGMVLVTGPTGSGKTTTLYAALSEIKNDEDKIITIEDPVEYQIKGITQIPVNEKKGLTFARGLRSILRHDPDKIMVGEIRDQETAQIAINAALTGHLVFTTVHANNVLDVLGRFLNMGVEPYNFVSALNCILAQRLVRVICDYCKRTLSAIPTHFWSKAVSIRRSGETFRCTKARAASNAAAPASAAARRSTSCST